MTFEQADNGRSNTVKDKSNCAACVLTHELRLRGFDVTAKPYNDSIGSISEQLSVDTRLAWFDSKGKRPQYTALITGSKDDITNKVSKHTAAVGGRYHIGWDITKQLGHIVTMERTEQGLIIYDPQNNSFLSLGEIIDEMMPGTPIQLLRVDTLLFVPSIVKGLTTLST